VHSNAAQHLAGADHGSGRIGRKTFRTLDVESWQLSSQPLGSSTSFQTGRIEMGKASRPRDYVLPSIDALTAFACMAASFLLRLDPGPALHAYSQRLVVASLAAAFIKPAIFSAMGLYSIYWRYVGPAEVRSVLGVCATGSVALAAGAALMQSWFPEGRGIPLSILAIDFLATTLGVGLVRFVANDLMVHKDAGRQRV
jgi:hypothetical protein